MRVSSWAYVMDHQDSKKARNGYEENSAGAVISSHLKPKQKRIEKERLAFGLIET